jgi:acetolactate synthase-1/2/3 large subunit
MRNAGRAVVDVLRAEGVRLVFGLPGGHVLSIYDALYDTPEITHVLVRHEQAAASMAAAHAQLTGKPGVCLVTAGPGCTNLLSGIAEAYVGSLPIVVLAGRGATSTAHRGAAQEVATDRVFAPVTKWSVRVDRADLIVDVLRQAFAVATSGRPGPVLVEIPRDLCDADVPDAAYFPVGAPARPAADSSSIAAAAEALANAERPLLVAGGGTVASGAFAQLRVLAELLAIPVLTSLAGRGSIPDDHPLSAGGLGAHRNRLSRRLLAEADVVVGLGCRFEEMETNWRPGSVPAPDACYVQVDIEPAEIGRSVPARIGVVGDIRTVIEQLLAELRERGAGLAPGAFADHPRTAAAAAELDAIEAELAVLAESGEGPLHPLRVIRAIRAAFPRETTVAIDVGCITQHIAGGTPFFRVYEPRSLIVPSSFYGMGFTAAGLPAARLVYPDRPAVGLVGDGSFQMVMNVLPVAAEYRLPVTWCVFDDRALGSIRDIQQYRFGDRILATEFAVQPDFASIARACGCHGEHVEDPDEVEGALARALEANDRGVPAVLDFVVARERMLQTLEHYAFYPQELVQQYLRPVTEAT